MLRQLALAALLGLGMVASTVLVVCGELVDLIDSEDA